MTYNEYEDKNCLWESTMDFVEIRRCEKPGLAIEDETDGDRGMLCLGCVTSNSGTLVNLGTVIVIGRAALSGELLPHTIE